MFLSYGWPGNVRELQNTIESTVVLCETDTITIRDIPESIRGKYEENQGSNGTGVCQLYFPGRRYAEGGSREFRKEYDRSGDQRLSGQQDEGYGSSVVFFLELAKKKRI